MVTRRSSPTQQSSANPDQVRSGLSPEQYMEAIRLQVLIRDTVGHPVSLLQALRIAHDAIPKLSKAWRASVANDLKTEVAEVEAKRVAEQQRIAQTAGK